MTTATLCTIQLLSKTYKVKCPDDEVANLQLAAQKLNDQLVDTKNKFKALDPFQTLLLAALHVSHELVVCQNQQTQQRQQLAEFISKTYENTPLTEW